MKKVVAKIKFLTSPILFNIKEFFLHLPILKEMTYRHKKPLKSVVKDSHIVNNRTARIAIIIILLAITLISQSFAWLYEEFVGPGADLTVGTISHSVKQYANNGNLLVEDNDQNTIIYETNMSNTTKSSKYIEITNTGTLDLEFSLNFLLEGTRDTTGILFYRLYDVTEAVNATNQGSYDTKLKAYADQNPISSTIETDTDIPINNMTLITSSLTISTIPVSSSKIYRMDYGMYSSVTTSQYSGDSFSLHMKVYSSQVGVISSENREGTIWNVQTEAQFREILLSAISGDTIKLLENININGSVNISKRVNIDTNDHNLVISDDLIYDYTSLGELSIDVSGLGHLEVGNDFLINAPNSDVTFIGENKSYDIEVNGDFDVNVNLNEESNGFFLDHTRIVKNKDTLVPADLTITSNSRVTIGPEVQIGYIYGKEGSTNIEIINNGYITQIDLSQMDLLSTFVKYQIYVYNLGEIYGVLGGTSIVLPEDATPYESANVGNTLIIRGITSGNINVSGSDSFTNDDINNNEDDTYVVPITDEDDAYIVYIKDSVSSIQSLLTDYFNLYNVAPAPKINAIKKLIVYTLNAQYVENEDFDFMNSTSMSNLEYLSLERARVIDNSTPNRIKSYAMYNKTTLKTLILPNYLTEIGSYAFYNCPLGQIPANISQFNYLTIPATVTSIESHAFSAATYVKFAGTVPPTVGTDAFDDSARFFVIPGTINQYMSTGNLNSEYIYQNAELSDDGRYFVFETANGLGLSYIVNNYLSGTTLGIPNVITYRQLSRPLTAIGTNAYRALDIVNTNGVDASIPTTVDRIDAYAFYNLNINSMSLSNILTIGDYAFYQSDIKTVNAPLVTSIGNYAFANSASEKLTLNNIDSIGEHAFDNNDNLYEIDLGLVSSIGDYAFYDCQKIVRVYIDTIDSILVNNTEEIAISVGENAMFSNWGAYVDGRLRMYVTAATTESGRTVLSLFKDKFSANRQYIFLQGVDILPYQYAQVPSLLSTYTVRQINLVRANGSARSGLEIISYQGPDLNGNIPTSLPYNGVDTNVISIGEGAFQNAEIVPNSSIGLELPLLINIGDYAFTGVDLSHVVAPEVKEVGISAFEGSSVNYAFFENLLTLKEKAFYNCSDLYRIKLGNVTTIDSLAVANTRDLTSVFFDNIVRSTNYDSDAFDGAGTNINNRFRMYVPDTNDLVSYYRGLFPTWTNYIYPTGTIVGHSTYGSIEYDIGEYSVREVTYPDASGNPVTKHEIIEYHGFDLTDSYEFPETIPYNNDALSVNYEVSSGLGTTDVYINVVLTNTSDQVINNWTVNVELLGNMYCIANSEVSCTNNSTYATFYSATTNGARLTPGSTRNVTFHLSSTSTIINNVNFQTSSADVEGASVYEIISVGENAFLHTSIEENNTINIESDLLLHIGENAFKNLDGLRHVTLDNVVSIDYGAFENSSITQGSFKKLNFLGQKGFANCYNLYIIDLGSVRTMQSEAITNAPYLYRVLFSATRDITLDISGTALSNVGSLTNNRQRFYVTNGDSGDGQQLVDVYRARFPQAYRSYFYAYDYLVGSFPISGLIDNIDIGEYSVKNKTINNTTGFEIVEYHGPSVSSEFEIPTAIDLEVYELDVDIISSNTVADYGGGAHTDFVIKVTNNTSNPITSWQAVFKFLDAGTISSVSTWNNGGSFSGNKVTITNASWNGTLQVGASTNNISIRVFHSIPICDIRLSSTRIGSNSPNNVPVISIGDYAYNHTTFEQDASFDIDSTQLLNIGVSAFQDNPGIRIINAPNVTTIGDNAFNGATNLWQGYFNSLYSMGAYAFYNDSNLVALDIGNVHSVGNYALYGTTKIVQLFIRNNEYSSGTSGMALGLGTDSITNLGTAAGDRLRIYVPADHVAHYKETLPTYYEPYIYEIGIIVGDCLYDNNTFNMGEYAITEYRVRNVDGYKIIDYHGNDVDANFAIPDSFTYNGVTQNAIAIGQRAFILTKPASGYTWNLIIPDNILEIGDYAFYQSRINSMSAGTVYYVGKYAFAQCPNLLTVSFDSVEEVDEYGFYLNTRLTTVTLGRGVLLLGNYSFYNTWNNNRITRMNIATSEPPTVFEYSLPATFWIVGRTSPTIYVPRDAVDDYERATYFEDHPIRERGDTITVSNNTYSYEIIDDDRVRIIGYSSNRSNISLPDTFSIRNHTYQITEITADAFDGASSLSSITLGRYVNNVGNGFLLENSSVTQINVSNQNPYFRSLDGVLFDKTGDILVRYPNGKNDSSYQLPTNPFTPKAVASHAFYNNVYLQSVVLNSNIVAISETAFQRMDSLASITFSNTTPPYILGFESFPIGVTINYPLASGGVDNYANKLYFNWYSSYLNGT